MGKVSLQEREDLGSSRLFEEKRREPENEGGVWKENKMSPFLISFDYGRSAAAPAGSWALSSWM